MKKTKVKKVIAVIMAMVMCLGMTNTFVSAATADDSVISPQNVAIISTSNELTLNSNGKLECYGKTATQYGYTAGIIVELQRNGTTIKTWTDNGGMTALVDETYTYTSGYTYQLKLTHKAYNSAGTLVESFVKYSNVI